MSHDNGNSPPVAGKLKNKPSDLLFFFLTHCASSFEPLLGLMFD
jgi:hypothetical protein